MACGYHVDAPQNAAESPEFSGDLLFIQDLEGKDIALYIDLPNTQTLHVIMFVDENLRST